MKQQKGRSIWKRIPEMKERLVELVRDGVLVNEGTVQRGIDSILRTLREEFNDILQEPGYRLTRISVRSKLHSVIWTPEVKKLIEEVVRHHRPVDDFLRHCPYIPSRVASTQYRKLAGLSGNQKSVQSATGFGRIASAMRGVDVEQFQLPSTSFEEPVKIEAHEGDSVVMLNGVNLGIPHGGLIRDNPARRALADAERQGDAAVVITNFLHLDTKKAGGAATVFRALTSGANVNAKNFTATYAQKANAILDQRPVGGIVYQTTEEMFWDGMRGWEKIATMPNGKPEFSGPILIVLGHKEEDLVATAAYWEANYWTRVKQSNLDIDIRIAQKALEVALERHDPAIQEIERELQELQEERARTIVSNIHPEEWQRYYQKVLMFFVQEIEKAIPNSKVIGMGTTYIQLGDEVVEVHIPKHTRVKDGLLADYTRTYGPKVLRGKMAPTVVICHPYALNFRTTVRERDSMGKRGSSEVIVAPITVDERYLRETFSDQVRSLHGIARVVNSEQFAAGMLRLEIVNGVVNPVNFPISALDKKQRRGVSSRHRYDTKFMWIMVTTDSHFGSPSREHLQLGNGMFRGTSEAVIEMLRVEGFCNGALPIHMFVVNDDPTQGHHFPIEQQPHPKRAPYSVIEAFIRDQLQRVEKIQSPKELRLALNRVSQLALTQLLRRGEVWTQDQVLSFMDHLVEANLDFFEGVIDRAIGSGLQITGIGAFNPDVEGFTFDTRDPGIINFGTGNHFQKSVNGELTEGVLYAQQLRALLRTIPKWRDGAEMLQQLVRAPLYGHMFVSYGILQAPGGYPWTLDLRSTPPKMQGWEDPLRGWVNVDLRRGNYPRILDAGMSIKVCGDKHFFGSVATPNALYHMSAPDTPTDPFAEWAGGFPPNNTGVSFIGLPVDGPESGPIIVRALRFDRILGYFDGTNPEFDWERFLPNPL